MATCTPTRDDPRSPFSTFQNSDYSRESHYDVPKTTDWKSFGRYNTSAHAANPVYRPPRYMPPCTPLAPSFRPYHHWRGSYHACRSDHHWPYWPGNSYVSSEESFTVPSEPVPSPFRGQWSFESAFAEGKENHAETRPVSPLGHVRASSETGKAEGYQPGYAETISDGDEDRGGQTEEARSGEGDHPKPDGPHKTTKHATNVDATTDERIEPLPWMAAASSSCPGRRSPLPSIDHLHGTESDLLERWHTLLAREAKLITRETCLEEAETRLTAQMQQLAQDRNELAVRERQVRGLQYELQMEQHRFNEERRRPAPQYERRSWHWQPDVWAQEMDLDSECDEEAAGGSSWEDDVEWTSTERADALGGMEADPEGM